MDRWLQEFKQRRLQGSCFKSGEVGMNAVSFGTSRTERIKNLVLSLNFLTSKPFKRSKPLDVFVNVPWIVPFCFSIETAKPYSESFLFKITVLNFRPYKLVYVLGLHAEKWPGIHTLNFWSALNIRMWSSFFNKFNKCHFELRQIKEVYSAVDKASLAFSNAMVIGFRFASRFLINALALNVEIFDVTLHVYLKERWFCLMFFGLRWKLKSFLQN